MWWTECVAHIHRQPPSSTVLSAANHGTGNQDCPSRAAAQQKTAIPFSASPSPVPYRSRTRARQTGAVVWSARLAILNAVGTAHQLGGALAGC